MKLTFPHLGQAYLAAELAMKEMGIEHIAPPENTGETLTLGREVSPEEMCLPFKYMAGNLIQAYHMGARQVVMLATMGPCRLGEYGELLKQVLDRAGCEMDWILLDAPSAIGIRQWLFRLSRAGCQRQVSLPAACLIIGKGFRLMEGIDRVEGRLKSLAGHAKDPAECVRMIHRFRTELRAQDSLKKAFGIIRRYQREAESVDLDLKKEPVNILVTGEIYTLIEASANQNLEEMLMLLGCSVRRPVTISWWMRRTLRTLLPEGKKEAERYLPYSIGGYAKETTAEIESCCEDGVIKIMPSGCMPEIVAKAASSRIESEKGTKILHLIFDELQGTAGYETRVEAFVDMLERSKRVFLGN